MSEVKSYFGTDGIRGVAGTYPLDPETLVRLGKAIAKIFLRRKGKHQILIAKDTRLSGYMIETALSAGITASGADVLLVGPIPTPGASYLTKSMRADAGVMISASHNPFEDNGIKLFGADGFKLDDDLEKEIENLLDSDKSSLANAESSEIGKATRINDAIGRYTVYLKEAFPREFTLDGLKIGLDCGNGAGYVVGPQTFKELGAEVVSRGISPTGRNINAGFGSLYPEVMSKLVVEQNLNLGVSLDGDADRCILIDEKGQVLDGDVILAICSADLHQRGKLTGNTVVSTVMSNLGLEKYLKSQNIRLLRTQVGDRYVLETMLKSGAIIGGEQSGHTIFLNHASTGDGILTALMVLSVMCRTGKTLSELSKDFIKFPQKLVNINVSSKPPLETLPAVASVIAKKEKELQDSGRILVRYSGTENKARVMVECENEAECKKHASDVAEVIERELGVC
jgi:phosphoglucosamine mutase